MTKEKGRCYSAFISVIVSLWIVIVNCLSAGYIPSIQYRLPLSSLNVVYCAFVYGDVKLP